jgi:hypothetical protein
LDLGVCGIWPLNPKAMEHRIDLLDICITLTTSDKKMVKRIIVQMMKLKETNSI